MKNAIDNFRYRLPMLVFALFMSACAFAQDNSSTTETHTTTNTTAAATADPSAWYMQPWAWIAGGVVLLIILIAAFRGSNKTKQEVTRTYTTTTEVKND